MQITVSLILILPALMPVNLGFHSRQLVANGVEGVANPLRLVTGIGKFSSRPFCDKNRFLRIKPRHFLVRPIDQRPEFGPWFIGELLAVNAQSKPIDMIRPWII